MNEQPCGKLAAKLAKILGEIGQVPKSGHNSFHNYDYVTENDLVYAVRKKLSEHLVFVFSSVEEQTIRIVEDGDRKSALTEVTTLHTFVDGESGEQFSVRSKGQGADVGDKGGYKAITGAMKYFLYKCFMIPTGDDPEADERTDVRGATGGKTPAPAKPVPTPGNREYDSNPPGRPGGAPDNSEAKTRMPAPSDSWKTAAIHFGKDKGRQLGSLPVSKLDWYANSWFPKPFGNRGISEEDKTLRSALDVYIAGATPKPGASNSRGPSDEQLQNRTDDRPDDDIKF